MAEQDVKALLEKVNEDADFRRKLEEASTPAEKHQVVADAGFNVSESDLSTLRKEEGVEGEISDAELEKVAGGMGGTTETTLSVVSTLVAGALAA